MPSSSNLYSAIDSFRAIRGNCCAFRAGLPKGNLGWLAAVLLELEWGGGKEGGLPRRSFKNCRFVCGIEGPVGGSEIAMCVLASIRLITNFPSCFRLGIASSLEAAPTCRGSTVKVWIVLSEWTNALSCKGGGVGAILVSGSRSVGYLVIERHWLGRMGGLECSEGESGFGVSV